MSKHPFYSLNCPNNKRTLLLTPCPGTMEGSVEAALNNLKSSDAKAVITLMTLEEIATRVLTDLAGEGVVISKDLLNGLSPYRNSNINRFGDYNLDLEREVPPLDFGIKILAPEET